METIDFFRQTQYAPYVDCLHDLPDTMTLGEVEILIKARVDRFVDFILHPPIIEDGE
jgi:hypothetical protein